MAVCSTDRLYHYLLQGSDVLDSILRAGLLPLSALPDKPQYHMTQPGGFFEMIYRLLAEPIIGRPYSNSGVFLTPIDFRAMPDTPLAALTRLAIPLAAVEAASAVLTYELEGERKVFPLSREALESSATIWHEDLLRSWFGKDPTKMFYYVPQVAAYQEGGIKIQPGWVERPGRQS